MTKFMIITRYTVDITAIDGMILSDTFYLEDGVDDLDEMVFDSFGPYESFKIVETSKLYPI